MEPLRQQARWLARCRQSGPIHEIPYRKQHDRPYPPNQIRQFDWQEERIQKIVSRQTINKGILIELYLRTISFLQMLMN